MEPSLSGDRQHFNHLLSADRVLYPDGYIGKVFYEVYYCGRDAILKRNSCAQIIAELQDEYGDVVKTANIKISAYIENPDGNLWYPGQVNTWGEASFFIRMPGNFDNRWKLKVGSGILTDKGFTSTIYSSIIIIKRGNMHYHLVA